MTQTITFVLDKTNIQEPRMYHVVFLNDNKTTVEFVEEVLMRYFGKTRQQAAAIIDQINNDQRAIAGTFYEDVALTKANIVINLARQNNYPFQVITEEAE